MKRTIQFFASKQQGMIQGVRWTAWRDGAISRGAPSALRLFTLFQPMYNRTRAARGFVRYTAAELE